PAAKSNSDTAKITTLLHNTTTFCQVRKNQRRTRPKRLTDAPASAPRTPGRTHRLLSATAEPVQFYPTPTSDSSSAKWQETQWSGSSSRHSGVFSLQMSCAKRQR